VVRSIHREVYAGAQAPAEAEILHLEAIDAVIGAGDADWNTGERELEVGCTKDDSVGLVVTSHGERDDAGLLRAMGCGGLQLDCVSAVGQRSGVKHADGSASSGVAVDDMHVT